MLVLQAPKGIRFIFCAVFPADFPVINCLMLHAYTNEIPDL